MGRERRPLFRTAQAATVRAAPQPNRRMEEAVAGQGSRGIWQRIQRAGAGRSGTAAQAIISGCAQWHRHTEWLDFLRQIERETPKEKDLHLISALPHAFRSHLRFLA